MKNTKTTKTDKSSKAEAVFPKDAGWDSGVKTNVSYDSLDNTNNFNPSLDSVLTPVYRELSSLKQKIQSCNTSISKIEAQCHKQNNFMTDMIGALDAVVARDKAFMDYQQWSQMLMYMVSACTIILNGYLLFLVWGLKSSY